MTSHDMKDTHSKSLNKKTNEGEYYLDLTPDQKKELEVVKRQTENGGFITMPDLEKKVKLWLSEK